MNSDKGQPLTPLQIAEQLNEIRESLSRLGAGLSAVKMTLAGVMESDPRARQQVLKQIEELEQSLAELDPNARVRKRRREAFQMRKLLDKHGGPKQA